MIELGDTEVDPKIFIWRLKTKGTPRKVRISGGAQSWEDRRHHDGTDENHMDPADTTKSKTLVKLKNLNKELRFITEGYFDFNEMIWKDQIDGRTLTTSEWYQNDSFYLRGGLKLDLIGLERQLVASF